MTVEEQIDGGIEALRLAGFRRKRLRIRLPGLALIELEDKLSWGAKVDPAALEGFLPGQLAAWRGIPVFAGPEVKVEALEAGRPRNHGILLG